MISGFMLKEGKEVRRIIAHEELILEHEFAMRRQRVLCYVMLQDKRLWGFP
jgi:hypothetical protein